MSNEEWLEDESTAPKSKKKSKSTSRDPPPNELIDDKFDAMLDSASKSANLSGSLKTKSGRKHVPEATSGWSNEMNDDKDTIDYTTNIPLPQAPAIRHSNRRAAEEIVAGDIPTISMDDADGDDAIDMAPEVAVAPEFSVHQIASFKEIEQDYSRERASQYIDSKIDIGILYHNLHLQETLDAEELKLWDWDKLFVEVRNSITNPATES